MSILKFILWFVCYFLFFGLAFVLPVRFIAIYIYAAFPENGGVALLVGGLWIGAFIGQLYFSYKCGVIKAGSRLGFLASIRLALKELCGHIQLLIGR